MFKFFWLSAVLLFLTHSNILAQAYGLSFNSHEVMQEKRTSLDLSPADSICFDKSMTLEFDVHLMPNRQVYFGYLVRIINGGQNIDILCTQQQIKIISGRQLYAVTIDTFTLFHQWTKIGLTIDRSSQSLQFVLNGKLIGKSPLHLPGNCYRFLWGANDHERFNTRDIPPMRIRDIRLLNNNTIKYHWPLADTSGLTSTDIISGKNAKAKNPVWVKPRHQQWQLINAFPVAGIAGVAFDQQGERLFIAGGDSLWTYDPRKEKDAFIARAVPAINFLTGHQTVYDTITRRLYDLYMDQKKMLRFDSAWSGNFKDTLLTEFWHANKFISPVDTSLYIIGGYGQLRYRNGVYRYHLPSGKWDTVYVTGDKLPPRYLAALGVNAAGDTAYILGGYGSVTGDQMLNPGNYYDLYTFDVRRRRFAKQYNFKHAGQHVAFANSLVIPQGGNRYYALGFPNGSFNSQLQLMQGALNDSVMQPVGNAIPYSFHDIQSFADLFYAAHSNKLLAVTFFYSGETEKLKTTQVKIWSIDFPPEPMQAATAPSAKKASKWWWLLLLTPLALLLLRRKKPATQVIEEAIIPVPTIPDRSIINLFGQFRVIDRDGNDITKQFTPLLKELFLLILVYTVRDNRGISSETLNEILWHDKPVKDAKNNRSVNLAKLKPILERVGPCVINKDTGAWELHCEDASVWIDYQVFSQLLQETGAVGKEWMQRFLQVAERGPFLQQTEYGWLDDIKSGVGNRVLDRCGRYIETHHATEDPEFIIAICNAIFGFDRLNEDALRYKCKSLIALKRHAVANTTYLSFVKEYREIYGEDFPRSFNEIIR